MLLNLLRLQQGKYGIPDKNCSLEISQNVQRLYKTRNAFVLHTTDPDEWGQQIEVDGGQGRIPRCSERSIMLHTKRSLGKIHDGPRCSADHFSWQEDSFK